jgi:Carboxylesterase family
MELLHKEIVSTAHASSLTCVYQRSTPLAFGLASISRALFGLFSQRERLLESLSVNANRADGKILTHVSPFSSPFSFPDDARRHHQRYGTVRGEDVPFCLGLPLTPLFPYNYTQQDIQTSRILIHYLANFIRTGYVSLSGNFMLESQNGAEKVSSRFSRFLPHIGTRTEMQHQQRGTRWTWNR